MNDEQIAQVLAVLEKSKKLFGLGDLYRSAKNDEWLVYTDDEDEKAEAEAEVIHAEIDAAIAMLEAAKTPDA